MPAECVDHSGVDVADDDAEENRKWNPTLGNSCRCCVEVVLRSCYVAALRCGIHVGF